MLTTERPRYLEVQGRGELQLAVLVEMLRREGFEITVGKPAGRDPDDRWQGARANGSGVDRRARRVPACRHPSCSRCARGRLVQMVNHGTGWARVDYSVPSRGFDRLSHGVPDRDPWDRCAASHLDRFEPWHGELRTRASGSLVADRSGLTTTYALIEPPDRGALFVGPGVEVYEGMIIGEKRPLGGHGRQRHEGAQRSPTCVSSTAEELVRLIPARLLSLEQALEFISEDECVEATPASVPAAEKVFARPG